MTKTVTEAHVQRSSDVSHGRRPLRLEIARRRKRTRAGNDKFVTEVRYGDSTALFVPWSAERGGSPASVLEPERRPSVEPLAA